MYLQYPQISSWLLLEWYSWFSPCLMKYLCSMAVILPLHLIQPVLMTFRVMATPVEKQWRTGAVAPRENRWVTYAHTDTHTQIHTHSTALWKNFNEPWHIALYGTVITLWTHRKYSDNELKRSWKQRPKSRTGRLVFGLIFMFVCRWWNFKNEG